MAQAAQNNNKLFPQYTKKLSQDDPLVYSTFAAKLALWLSSERAYYPDARHEIVKLLITAQMTLRRALGVGEDLNIPFHISNHHEHPMMRPYTNLLTIVQPYLNLFVEPMLHAHVGLLLQSIAPLRPQINPIAHLTTRPPISASVNFMHPSSSSLSSALQTQTAPTTPPVFSSNSSLNQPLSSVISPSHINQSTPTQSAITQPEMIGNASPMKPSTSRNHPTPSTIVTAAPKQKVKKKKKNDLSLIMAADLKRFKQQQGSFVGEKDVSGVISTSNNEKLSDSELVSNPLENSCTVNPIENIISSESSPAFTLEKEVHSFTVIQEPLGHSDLSSVPIGEKEKNLPEGSAESTPVDLSSKNTPVETQQDTVRIVSMPSNSEPQPEIRVAEAKQDITHSMVIKEIQPSMASPSVEENMSNQIAMSLGVPAMKPPKSLLMVETGQDINQTTSTADDITVPSMGDAVLQPENDIASKEIEAPLVSSIYEELNLNEVAVSADHTMEQFTTASIIEQVGGTDQSTMPNDIDMAPPSYNVTNQKQNPNLETASALSPEPRILEEMKDKDSTVLTTCPPTDQPLLPLDIEKSSDLESLNRQESSSSPMSLDDDDDDDDRSAMHSENPKIHTSPTLSTVEVNRDTNPQAVLIHSTSWLAPMIDRKEDGNLDHVATPSTPSIAASLISPLVPASVSVATNHSEVEVEQGNLMEPFVVAADYPMETTVDTANSSPAVEDQTSSVVEDEQEIIWSPDVSIDTRSMNVDLHSGEQSADPLMSAEKLQSNGVPLSNLPAENNFHTSPAKSPVRSADSNQRDDMEIDPPISRKRLRSHTPDPDKQTSIRQRTHSPSRLSSPARQSLINAGLSQINQPSSSSLLGKRSSPTSSSSVEAISTSASSEFISKEDNGKLFGKEMRIVACQKGPTNSSKINIRFDIPEEQFISLSDWKNRNIAPTNVRKSLCLSLGCYSSAELLQMFQRDEQKCLEEQISPLISSWPRRGELQMNVTFKGGMQDLPLSPPLEVTPNGLVDVSQFLDIGTNIIELDQSCDMSKYTFVLHAHHPTQAQLVQAEERRKKDQDWQNWILHASRPFDVPLFGTSA